MFKILSLNMHSYFEPRTYWAFFHIAKDIAVNGYDVVCLQEVNQLKYTEIMFDNVRADNAAYIVKLILQKEFNLNYSLFWDRAKTLDGLIEEGVAILTPHKIIKKDSKYVSTLEDGEDWRCRKNIFACIEKDSIKYNIFSVHFAWEDDGKERFDVQFYKFLNWIENKSQNLIVAGDFNIDNKSEAYNLMEETRWIDISKSTNNEHLETAYNENNKEIHIDYIFTNIEGQYEYSIKFNGEFEPTVSDHRGVHATII